MPIEFVFDDSQPIGDLESLEAGPLSELAPHSVKASRPAAPADDLARDLRADLDRLERATPGPWVWSDENDGGLGPNLPSMEAYSGDCIVGGPDSGRHYWMGREDQCWLSPAAMIVPGQHGIRTVDGDVMAQAREGWPIAIRRALAAEQRVKELEAAAQAAIAQAAKAAGCAAAATAALSRAAAQAAEATAHAKAAALALPRLDANRAAAAGQAANDQFKNV